MKKNYLKAFFLFLVLLCFTGCKKDDNLTKLTVAEVTHSVFYAPWYVALEEGYFEDESLDIEVILTPGADKTAAAVLSNDAQIGFSGPEATIYVFNNGEKDYLRTFAGLTKRDGQFIVGPCSLKDNFKPENLKGKSVLVGRSGGMPLMIFKYALKESKIDLSNVKLDASVEFAALSGAFIGGNGDFVNLFEPTASKIEKEGYGCVLASLGKLAGEVPYTAYYAKKSYIKDNEDTIRAFSNAINKGLEFVKENDSEMIAKKIIGQFADTSLKDLTTIVENYKTADSWWDNAIIKENAFDRLQDIMIYNEVLNEKVPFDKLVTNQYNG